MNSKASVRYYSKSGNTKKLAEEIAKAAGCKALSMDKSINEKVDILFLGASVYWGGVDKQVKEFIRSLDPNKIGKAAVFSTSAMTERAYPQIKKLLQEQGIQTVNQDFYCRGRFRVLHRNKPDTEDLKAASEYARAVCAGKQV